MVLVWRWAWYFRDLTRMTLIWLCGWSTPARPQGENARTGCCIPPSPNFHQNDIISLQDFNRFNLFCSFVFYDNINIRVTWRFHVDSVNMIECDMISQIRTWELIQNIKIIFLLSSCHRSPLVSAPAPYPQRPEFESHCRKLPEQNTYPPRHWDIISIIQFSFRNFKKNSVVSFQSIF